MGDATIEMRELYEELSSLRSRLNQLKRDTALGEVENFPLLDASGKPIKLSHLFGEYKDLIVIHSMGRGCVYCTLWADGLTGVAKHIASRTALAVVSPDPPGEFKQFSDTRGWPFPIASSKGSAFKRALGFETEDGSFMPGLSTFRKNGNEIRNVANDMFGPGDSYSAVWHMFDLLERGTDGWAPKYSYPET